MMSPIVLSPEVVQQIELVALITGLAGALLNARGRIESFYFWVVSNLALLLLAFQATYLTTTLLYLSYLGISIYGIYCWRRKAPVSPAQ
jgi:nicotinamide mononucleotide transporter